MADILSPAALDRALISAAPATVVHLAADMNFYPSSEARLTETNVAGTRNLLDACAARFAGRKIRLVYVSSTEAVGEVCGGAASEGHPWQAWGIMESQAGRVEEARRIFAKGVEADPHSAPTLNAWARMEASNMCYAAARQLYAKATEADPTHTQSWQSCAVMEGRLRQFGEARRLFRLSVASNPTHAQAWQAWACMEFKAGGADAARDLFQKGVNAYPCHVAVWQAWADMEKKIGDWEQGPACSLPETATVDLCGRTL